LEDSVNKNTFKLYKNKSKFIWLTLIINVRISRLEIIGNRKPFSEFTIGDVVDFLMVTNHAIVDELHEMMDAVGGIEDGEGNAAWKPWKSKNPEIRNKRLSDLTPGDLKELKMEWIDVMHFVFNAGLAIGVTPKEFYNYYLSKNEENWNRQENNY
jgi:hypothetical protein